jgi:hypothetical protein
VSGRGATRRCCVPNDRRQEKWEPLLGEKKRTYSLKHVFCGPLSHLFVVSGDSVGPYLLFLRRLHRFSFPFRAADGAPSQLLHSLLLLQTPFCFSRQANFLTGESPKKITTSDTPPTVQAKSTTANQTGCFFCCLFLSLYSS